MLTDTILPMAVAFVMDWLLGDPAWFPHPVVGFGRLITHLEGKLLRVSDSPARQVRMGLVLLACLVLTAVVPILLVRVLTGGLLRVSLTVVLFWLSLSHRTMGREALAVADRLEHGSLAEARRQVARIVGRDTAALSETGVARACIESVAESTSDGIIAPLFWGLVLGPAGAMAYKAVNTLDSMVGYRSDKYQWFGKASARADDVANFLPARLTAVLTVLLAGAVGGNFKESLKVYRRDRAKHASPNSGHPEAAFAGVLGLELAGPAVYDGTILEKPYLNQGARVPRTGDIHRAVQLMTLTVGACLALAFIITLPLGGPRWTVF